MNMITMMNDKQVSPLMGKHGKPLIDKITITVPSPNKVYSNSVTQGGSIDHDATFKQAAYAAVEDKDLFHSATHNKYYISVRVVLANSIERPLLQVLPKNPVKNPYLRLEFNPFKLGPKALMELAACLIYFLDSGSDYVWQHGRVSRLDVAIDLYGVEVGQLRLTSSSQLTERTFGTNGKFETIYIGKSKGQQTKIYNKLKQLKLIAQEPITRIERSLKKQMSLQSLITLVNPFLHLNVAAVLPAKPKSVNLYTWELYCDAVEKRGPVAANALLPLYLRKIITNHLKKYPHSVWQPAKFWEAWPQAVGPLIDAFQPI